MKDAADRTIPATPRRRELARRQGLMPSAGLPASAATVATTLLLLPAWGQATFSAATDMIRRTCSCAASASDASLRLEAAMPAEVIMPTVGLVAVAGAVGLAVRMLLDAPAWRPARILPAFDRIGLLAGLARIFSTDTLAAVVGHACGLAVLLTATALSAGPLIAIIGGGAVVREPARVLAAAQRAILPLVAVAAAVAACQWALSWLRFERRIRMTPQEYADESRSMQADPKVRLMRQQRHAVPAKNGRG